MDLFIYYYIYTLADTVLSISNNHDKDDYITLYMHMENKIVEMYKSE